MALKPLGKAIVIGLPIVLAIAGYTYFAPKATTPEVVAAQPVVPTPVTTPSAESTAVERAAQLANQPTQAAPEPVAPTPQRNVTSGDAGLDAVLNAGKK